MKFLEGVATNAPIWVWPLLLVLIYVGVSALRNRTTSTYLVYAYPLLSISALGAVRGLADPQVAWLSFLVGFAFGAWQFYQLQGRWILEKTRHHVRLAGEPYTLLFLMLVFWSNFVAGVLEVLSPATLTSLPFIVLFALILGTASGSFLGRSLRVITAKSAD